MEVRNTGFITKDTPFCPQNVWQKMYTTDAYQVRKDFALHFQIAYGNSNAILKYVNTLKEKKPERLFQKDPQNQNLTPLHIAAMKGNLVVAEIILECCPNAKEALNTPDHNGWTPLHAAAVTSDSLYQRFLELGGDKTIRTKNRGDCVDLLALTGRVRDTRPRSTLYTNEKGNIEECNEASMEKILGKEFIFTDSPLFTSENLFKLWSNKDWELPLTDDASMVGEFYNISKKQPLPAMLITQCPEMKKISAHFLECRAAQIIPQGSYISEYSGEKKTTAFTKNFLDSFETESIKKIEYLFEDIDGTSVGNETRFFNCGFPNIMPIFLIENGTSRMFFAAIREIKQGEPLLWSYGITMNNLVFGRQILLGKEEMAAFFTENIVNLETTLKNNMNASCTNFQEFIKIHQFENLVHYVMDNPTALLYLHFNNIVDFGWWKEKNPHYTSWSKKHVVHTFLVACIEETLEKVKTLSLKGSFKKTIDSWVLNKLEKDSLIDILKGLDLLTEKPIKGLQKLESSLKSIDLILQKYNWKKDPNYPFNLERRCRILIKYYRSRLDPTTIKNMLITQMQTLDKESESYILSSMILKKI